VGCGSRMGWVEVKVSMCPLRLFSLGRILVWVGQKKENNISSIIRNKGFSELGVGKKTTKEGRNEERPLAKKKE